MAEKNNKTQSRKDENRLYQLTLEDRKKVWWRSQLLQASWNYERMQNLGWCYALIPAIKKLYPDPEDQKAAIKRHLEFFNTHPYVAAPIFGVEMSLEEDRANGAPVDDAAIQGVKIGMMGPLAGVGDPVFWGTLRPVLGAFAASLALSGSIMGAIVFFVVWNAIRLAFLWYTQEGGYQAGDAITEDLSGGAMRKITTGASILGMFIMGVLIPRWTSMPMNKVVFSNASMGPVAEKFPGAQAFFDLMAGGGKMAPDAVYNGITGINSLAASGMNMEIVDGVPMVMKLTTLQTVLDELLPGLLPLLLTFGCIKLLKKKVSPLKIIAGLFAIGILGAIVGIF